MGLNKKLKLLNQSNIASSRNIDTWYTNNTGNVLFVSIRATLSNSISMSLIVETNGTQNQISIFQGNTGDTAGTISGFVGPGEKYKVNMSVAGLTYANLYFAWFERPIG